MELRLLSIAIALLLAPASARAEIIDRILAVVGSELVTLSDVRAALNLGLERAPDAGDRIGATLDRLIERELALVEVNRYSPPEPAAASIDARLAELRAAQPSPARFDALLVESGVTLEQLRRRVRDDLRLQTYLEQRFNSEVVAERRATVIREWLDGLRRRAAVTVLYLRGSS